MKITTRTISITLATLFMCGIVVAMYTLYQSDIQGIPNRFYLLLGVASIAGSAALIMALTERIELKVYQDRKKTETDSGQSQGNETKTTISLDAVKAALKSAHKPNDIMQQGLTAICKQLEVGQGAFYGLQQKDAKKFVGLKAGYALAVGEESEVEYELGEGLIGQAAATGQTLYLDEVPEGYVKIISGLGSSSPRFILIVAAKKDNQVLGVIELASFAPFTADQRRFVEEGAKLIAEKLPVNLTP
jgi:putative methionine-R-sulfoxide reductase with GAF domain